MLDVLIAQRDCKHAGRSFAEPWVRAEYRGRIEAGIVMTWRNAPMMVAGTPSRCAARSGSRRDGDAPVGVPSLRSWPRVLGGRAGAGTRSRRMALPLRLYCGRCADLRDPLGGEFTLIAPEERCPN